MSDLIRNPEGIWINAELFREAGNFFIKNGVYTFEPVDSPLWYEFWKEERNRCINGYSVGGARITGDHYFYLNYCPITRIDMDSVTGKTANKVSGLPYFWDGDYNYFWVREIARKGILQALGIDNDKVQKIYDLSAEKKEKVLKKYYDKLKLFYNPLPNHLEGGLDVIVLKARRKGFEQPHSEIIMTPKGTITMGEVQIGDEVLTPKGKTKVIDKFYQGKKDVYEVTLFDGRKVRCGFNHLWEVHDGNSLENCIVTTKHLLKYKSISNYYLKVNNSVEYEEKYTTFSYYELGRTLSKYVGCILGIDKYVSIKQRIDFIKGLMDSDNYYADSHRFVYFFETFINDLQELFCSLGIVGIKSFNESNGYWELNVEIDKSFGLEDIRNRNWFMAITDVKKLGYKEKSSCIMVEDPEHLYLTRGYIPTHNSHKNSAVSANNFFHKPKTYTMVMAYEKKYLYPGQKTFFGKCLDYISFINENTAWTQPSDYINRQNHIKASYKQRNERDGIDIEKGLLSEIEAISFKDNPDAGRGANAYDIFGEEVGAWGTPGGLKDTVAAMRASSEAGRYKTGMMTLFGCVCGGTKVYNRRFKEVNIEDITKRTGIIGYGGEGVTKEPVSYLKEPAYKNCFRIETSDGSFIECSYDHPLLSSREAFFIGHYKAAYFETASALRVGEQLLKLTDTPEIPDESTRYRESYLNFKFVYNINLKGKGAYFEGKILENLTPVKIVKIIPLGKKKVYNLTANLTHTYITNKFISHNTSGDLEAGTVDFAEMFESPESFGFMSFNDIWGDMYQKTEGFFFPKQLNMDGFYDRQGNSQVEEAKDFELSVREKLVKAGATSQVLQKRLQEEPLNSSEALAAVSNNTFPVVELKRQLDKVIALKLQEKKGIPVEFIRKGEEVTVKPILGYAVPQPITTLRHKNSDIRGCPVIYEFPKYKPIRGLYKIGYDPIRQDSGTSLAGIIVYKSPAIGEYFHDNIVAEYIGRYNDPDDIDALAENFADYFNTEIMYENEVTGVRNFFRRKKRLHLLASQPDLVISKNISNSKTSRVYGCHMTVALKDAGERYIKTWLLSVIDYDEHGDPVTVIDRLYSRRLLEELINYNRKGNFDLVSSLIMCMFQVQEEQLGKEYTDEDEYSTAKKLVSRIGNMYRKSSYRI